MYLRGSRVLGQYYKYLPTCVLGMLLSPESGEAWSVLLYAIGPCYRCASGRDIWDPRDEVSVYERPAMRSDEWVVPIPGKNRGKVFYYK